MYRLKKEFLTIKHIKLSTVFDSARQNADQVRKSAIKQFKRTRTSLKKTFAKKRNKRRLIYVMSAITIAGLLSGMVGMQATASQHQYELKQTLQAKQQNMLKLKETLHSTQMQKAQTEDQVKAKDQALQDTQKQIDDLNAQLQAKRAQQADDIRLASYTAPVQATAPTPIPVVSDACVTGYATGDYYLDKIIAYESGGNSCAYNPGGCYGLLQACPGSELVAACGGSPGCQIAWFQANKTGGRSWSQVWQHELDYGWW